MSKAYDALKLFSGISVTSFSCRVVGQATHLPLSNDRGELMGDGILMHLVDDGFHARPDR